MKLDNLSLPQPLSHGQGAGACVHSNDVANEKVPQLRVILKLIHHHSQKQRMAQQLPVPFVQGFVELSQHLQGWFAIQLQEEILLALCNIEGLSNGAATLSYYGVDDNVTVERQPHSAGAIDLVVQNQSVTTGILAAAGHPANLYTISKGVVQPQQ